MSSFQDSAWLRRLWSLAKPGDPLTDYVTNVQTVNDRGYASSRERAPYASASNSMIAQGAGVHNFVEIGGVDLLGPTTNLLHAMHFEVEQSTVLTGVVSWIVQDGAALTTVARVATTPTTLDPDPDVTPVLFIGSIATAQLPATRTQLPRFNSIGITAATPSFPTVTTEIPPCAGLPFAASWLGPRNLMFFSETPNVVWNWFMSWQAIRS